MPLPFIRNNRFQLFSIITEGYLQNEWNCLTRLVYLIVKWPDQTELNPIHRLRSKAFVSYAVGAVNRNVSVVGPVMSQYLVTYRTSWCKICTFSSFTHTCNGTVHVQKPCMCVWLWSVHFIHFIESISYRCCVTAVNGDNRQQPTMDGTVRLGTKP